MRNIKINLSEEQKKVDSSFIDFTQKLDETVDNYFKNTSSEQIIQNLKSRGFEISEEIV